MHENRDTMNFQFYLEKLYDSPSFEKFKSENPSAFPCGGFFSIDREEGNKTKDDKQHLDFFIPETKKLFSFKLEDNCSFIPVENPNNQVPNKISANYDFDFNEIEEQIEEEMGKKEIKNKIQKLLFSLQNVEGKDYLIGTIFISGMGILKIHYDISEKSITHFEKKSFMDMINIFKGKKE